MNKKTVTLLVLTAIIAASFMLFVPASSQEGVATAIPTQTLELPTSTQEAPASSVSVDALQKYAGGEIQTQVVNGIEMSASNFRIEENLLKVNTCYTTPDNLEWTIGESTLHIGGNDILLLGGHMLEISQSLGNGTGEITTNSDGNIKLENTNYNVSNYLCYTLLFLAAAEQLDYSDVVSLTVRYINTFPPEGQQCAFTEKTQSILDKKGSGIKISCTPTFSNGLASGDKEILEKPQGMSEEEALQHISEAYRQAITIDGPWVFEGTVTTTP